MLVVQVFLSVGIVIGFAFLLPSVDPEGVAGQPFLVLAAWCVAGLAITLRVMTRRD